MKLDVWVGVRTHVQTCHFMMSSGARGKREGGQALEWLSHATTSRAELQGFWEFLIQPGPSALWGYVCQDRKVEPILFYRLIS